MKKLTLLLALLTTTTISISAEELESQETNGEKATIEVPAWVKNIKFSGYGMLRYQADDKYQFGGFDDNGNEIAEKNHANSFSLRLARLILDGKIADFDWRVQIQATNAKGPGEPTVQLVDLYAEWRKYPEFKVRVGQFKRAFTFENPTHPITQGWRGYADVINNLSGFGDRTGEKSSGGRDIGIQAAGDLFPNSNGRRLLHYQVGVYNGEGINSSDKDNRKDIIGGMWVMPIQGVRIGAFGWTGSRGGVEKNRYCLSAEYDKDGYTFRTEFIHSQGWGSNLGLGDKADGWYAFGIVPVINSKLYAKARYQCYRDNKEWNRAKTSYEVGMNYFFTKNLELHLEYARVNDKTIPLSGSKHSYNLGTVELDFRF